MAAPWRVSNKAPLKPTVYVVILSEVEESVYVKKSPGLPTPRPFDFAQGDILRTQGDREPG